MSDCDLMTESMPLLLTESLEPARRELTHQHIEQCPVCSDEWTAMKETWQLLGDMPELEVPPRVKQKFLAEIGQAPVADTPANVVPFRRRPVLKWIAQAAAVAIIAGGSFFAGHRGVGSPQGPLTAQKFNTPAQITDVQPVKYSIAETRTLDASSLSPNIEGRPDIQNVQFIDDNPNDDKIGVAFDVTQHVTVNGDKSDKSMVRLLAYVLENEGHTNSSSSRAIDWIRQTYKDPQHADPEITRALASVLRNDENQGVRIKAVETLKTLPAKEAAPETRQALIEALKNDPNPAVRIKAVDALANLARNGESFDTAAVDTLRQKATQGDENLYVRVKAAEALSNIH